MNAVTEFLQANGSELLLKTWEHIYISYLAVILGIIVAIPLGIALTRVPRVAQWVIGIVSVMQTIPSLAILAFFIPFLGIGTVPAVLALFIYSVLPILRNTYTSVKDVDDSLIEAGRGMGMTTWERIKGIELPLASPVIMAGIRVSSVYLIGWAALASFIGAGGLGDFIFSGLNLYDAAFIIGGAIPVTILALLTDIIFGRIEKLVTPKGIRDSEKTA
ncbi:ABC transporter permease [Alkalicoccobacillus murimartini]|uniref:Osmoprotectant transport system permease protein n=1 Tax=Alkalicoccobacillus murimartini TaxID=171685 RepID=A0ABT9YD23_9BACI|nr:ABC transporter permease [Alkalicoccobacillus murimartini]MDQ0205761.1 osmoprotectant transport system permease protein [Alkalicoccobacillus murimartini]